MEIENQYPIGKLQVQDYSPEAKEKALNDIKLLPDMLEAALSNLDEYQLHTPYREGGWTVHQVVHHIADAHLNAYIRLKLGLTENNPTINPFDENLWAELDDVKTVPVNVSATLLHALHQRMYEALKNLTEADWMRTVFHPGQQKEMTLWDILNLYSWHGKHHVAQINYLREKMKW